MNTDFSTLSTGWISVIVILALWELVWKGLALWRASKHDAKVWFVILLIINTAGILPIIYLLLTREQQESRAKLPA